VQLIRGMVLHEGDIAEMKTGEGKTLVATLAVYLNALAGKGGSCRHRQRYLARRDAGWMGPIYSFLGHDHRRDRSLVSTTPSASWPMPATSPTHQQRIRLRLSA